MPTVGILSPGASTGIGGMSGATATLSGPCASLGRDGLASLLRRVGPFPVVAFRAGFFGAAARFLLDVALAPRAFACAAVWAALAFGLADAALELLVRAAAAFLAGAFFRAGAFAFAADFFRCFALTILTFM